MVTIVDVPLPGAAMSPRRTAARSGSTAIAAAAISSPAWIAASTSA
jgi:hypothetical protein